VWAPQGSVLGPLLFISYIDDVSRVIRYSRFHIYEEDVRRSSVCMNGRLRMVLS
jgi:hypothetical protein